MVYVELYEGRAFPKAFHYVVGKIGVSGGMRSIHLPLALRLALTLKLLASVGYQRQGCTNHIVSVAQSTLSTVILDALQELEIKPFVE